MNLFSCEIDKGFDQFRKVYTIVVQKSPDGLGNDPNGFLQMPIGRIVITSIDEARDTLKRLDERCKQLDAAIEQYENEPARFAKQSELQAIADKLNAMIDGGESFAVVWCADLQTFATKNSSYRFFVGPNGYLHYTNKDYAEKNEWAYGFKVYRLYAFSLGAVPKPIYRHGEGLIEN